jgi:hypothetical protein
MKTYIIELYIRLILEGNWSIDDVPSVYRADVELRMQELE